MFKFIFWDILESKAFQSIYSVTSKNHTTGGFTLSAWKYNRNALSSGLMMGLLLIWVSVHMFLSLWSLPCVLSLNIPTFSSHYPWHSPLMSFFSHLFLEYYLSNRQLHGSRDLALMSRPDSLADSSVLALDRWLVHGTCQNWDFTPCQASYVNPTCF